MLGFLQSGREERTTTASKATTNPIKSFNYHGLATRLDQPLGLSYIVERIGNENQRVSEESGFAYTLEWPVRWNHREQRTEELGHEEQEGYDYGRDKPLFATQSEHHPALEGIDAKCIVQHRGGGGGPDSGNRAKSDSGRRQDSVEGKGEERTFLNRKQGTVWV